MTEILWTYDAMYKWYAKQEKLVDHTNDVYTFVYESQKPSRNDKNKVEPFITPNMVCIGKSPIDTRLYTVVERNTENTKKKWLFFVYPEEKDCSNDKVLFANHLSFCIDTTDKSKPVHFHSTNYICTVVQNTIVYGNIRTNDYFADTLVLPREGDVSNIITEAVHKHMKPSILGIMRYPWAISYGGNISGGAGKKRTQIARPIKSQEFCDMWNRCQFKGMCAFGIPLQATSQIRWTVRFIRRIGERNKNHVHRAYVFTTDTVDENAFQEKLFSLANSHEEP